MPSPARLAPVLAAAGVAKRFAGSLAPAVREVELELEPGAAIAIVGQSGSGKSTLLRLFAGLDAPTSGSILYRGKDLARFTRAERAAFRRKVQLVFQDPFASLNPTKPVEHAVVRPLVLGGARRDALERRVGELLEAVGLPTSREFRKSYPHELSGGQRQRVAIARAIASDPEVLLADEPTSMLDVSIRVSVLNLLIGLQRERGIALVLVTHDLASASYVARELCVMQSGYLVERGPGSALGRSPLHPYSYELVAALPGSPLPPLPGASRDAVAHDPASGCPWCPRCSRAVPACGVTMPRTEQLGARHVRCYAPLQRAHE